MSTKTEAVASKPAKSTRKLIVRGVFAAIMLVGGYFGYRITSLSGLPNIPPPFDRERDGFVDIRPEDNAFTYYIRAHGMLRTLEPESKGPIFADWSEVGEPHRKYIEENRAAFDVWFEGTKRNRAVYIQPREITFATDLPVVQKLRSFSRTTNLIALRYEHEGDFAKAWEWYLANLRASRHLGQHGVAIEFLVGSAIYANTKVNVIRWSKNPKVTAAQLKQALQDVLELDALTGPTRNMVCAEYFGMINTLEDPVLRNIALSADGNFPAPKDQKPESFAKSVRSKAISAYGTIRRDTERSSRVIRLVFSNWLAAADLPAADRVKVIEKHCGIPLYRLDDNHTGPLSLDELAEWCETTLFAKVYLPGWGNIDATLARHEQTRAALIVHLAEQIYLREHGNMPESANELVGPYLQQLPSAYTTPSSPAR